MTKVDLWGEPVQATDDSSVEAWNTAWVDAMHFVGDSFETLSHANLDDDTFALGSVFCGVYRVLGGAPLGAVELVADLERARSRAASARELAHVEALGLLVAGNFTAAALRWDAMSTCLDFAAVRFAHDVYLHVGDAPRRLRSSLGAMARWGVDDPWWSFVAGQHAFSLEEAGLLNEAEDLALRALAADPMDLWALHALAHVYETRQDSAAARSLLQDRQPVWSLQDQLSVHVWWHLALRLIADGEFDAALEIHDQLVPVATTPFRLCDLISLLWRLELAGVDVGNRWASLADNYSIRPERHTSGFLDLHGAMVFTRQPEHLAAGEFFDGVKRSHHDGESENDEIFRQVVEPLVGAVQMSSASPASTVAVLDRLRTSLHRIGGSVAQRDIIELTRTALETTLSEDT